MKPDTTGDLGSILGVWGHPDDEAWLSSGLMMRAVGSRSSGDVRYRDPWRGRLSG